MHYVQVENRLQELIFVEEPSKAADAFVMREVQDESCPDALEITIDVEMTKRVWQLFEELHRANAAKRAIEAFHEWLVHVCWTIC